MADQADLGAENMSGPQGGPDLIKGVEIMVTERVFQNLETGEAHRALYCRGVRFTDERCQWDQMAEIKELSLPMTGNTELCGHCWGD